MKAAADAGSGTEVCSSDKLVTEKSLPSATGFRSNKARSSVALLPEYQSMVISCQSPGVVLTVKGGLTVTPLKPMEISAGLEA